jgi:hypothetical protein
MPPALQKEQLALQDNEFLLFIFCGLFLPCKIRIQIPNTDPQIQLYPESSKVV